LLVFDLKDFGANETFATHCSCVLIQRKLALMI